MGIVLLSVVALLVAPAAATARDAPEPLRVVIVPGLELDDLQAFVSRGAVGLLVPAAGPRTSRAQALAALERPLHSTVRTQALYMIERRGFRPGEFGECHAACLAEVPGAVTVQ